MILICIANFLNLFIPRFASEEEGGGYAVRLPIQLVYSLILVMMLYGIFFYRNKPFNQLTKSIYVFIIIVAIYLVYGIMTPVYINTPYSQYLKLITWLAAIVFFIKHGNLRNKWTRNLSKLYIFLFIIVAAKKMIEIRLIVDERSGGDTIGLTLVLIIPAILLLFEKNIKLIMTVIVALLIMLSIRRTAIIALMCSAPFILQELKAKFKPLHFMLFLCVLIVAVYFAWGYLGDTLYDRFQNIFVGDKGGEKDSYGSGRSDFYMITLNGWLRSPPPSFLFGHGVGAVKDLLRIEYGDIGHTHNDFLEVLYTYGFIGFVIWGLILFSLVKAAKLIKKYASHRLRLYKVSIISLFIISLSSGTLFKVEMMVFALSTGLILAEVTKKRKKVLLHRLLRRHERNASASILQLGNEIA